MMFGGNSRNRVLPVYLDDTQFQFQTNVANQLQFPGNLQAGLSVDPVNYFSNEHHITSMIQPNKQRTGMEDILQQRLQISLYNNNNVCIDGADQLAMVPNVNPVSTGLRLAYDDDERNSSLTSASGSMTAAPILFSLGNGDNIRTEFDRQQEEMDQFIKLQKEQLSKGVRDMRQRHMASLLSSIEKGLRKKLMEKDAMIANLNWKNRELVQKINQVAVEAENWQLRAMQNELVVNTLKNDLQQVLLRTKEGVGDSEDDAASSLNPNHFLSIQGAPIKPISNSSQEMEMRTCKVCKANEVSVLLLPCRHLCLCKDCSNITICPICQSFRTSLIHVQMS